MHYEIWCIFNNRTLKADLKSGQKMLQFILFKRKIQNKEVAINNNEK